MAGILIQETGTVHTAQVSIYKTKIEEHLQNGRHVAAFQADMESGSIHFIENVSQGAPQLHGFLRSCIFIGNLFVSDQCIFEVAGEFSVTVCVFQNNVRGAGKVGGQGIIGLSIRLFTTRGGIDQFFQLFDLVSIFSDPAVCEALRNGRLPFRMGADVFNSLRYGSTVCILYADPVIDTRIQVKQIQSILVEQQIGNLFRIILKCLKPFEKYVDVIHGMVKVAGDKLIFMQCAGECLVQHNIMQTRIMSRLPRVWRIAFLQRFERFNTGKLFDYNMQFLTEFPVGLIG